MAATAVVTLLCPGLAESQSPSPSPTPAFKSFAIYALSRGKGVPVEAREALRKVREVVDGDSSHGVNVKVQSKRIGIEGETRVCAEYGDAKDAGRAFERARALVKGVDLVNLVAEPCDKPPAADGQKEEGKP